MRVILGALCYGFGPASKLTAIAKLLEGSERIFVGGGAAYEFAARNAHCYEAFLTVDEFASQETIADSCDFAIIVMEPDLGFRLIQRGLPVYSFDSVLDFWILPNGMGPLATAALEIRQNLSVTGKRIFEGFTFSERQVLAHMLSRRSFAQNSPGVPQRIAELHRHGFPNIELLGPILDLNAGIVGVPSHDASDRWSMLVTLGGVRNFVVDYFKNDYVVDLMEHWAAGYLSDREDCTEIILCCGRYKETISRRIGHGRLVCQFASHDEFMTLLQNTDILLSSPGRTTLLEAHHLGKLPILLPEQHYNQHQNLKALEGTKLRELSIPLDSLVDMGHLPPSSPEATDIIVNRIRAIVESKDLFQRFDSILRERVQRVRVLDAAARSQLLAEIQPFVSGRNFVEAIRSIVVECEEARSNAIMRIR